MTPRRRAGAGFPRSSHRSPAARTAADAVWTGNVCRASAAATAGPRRSASAVAASNQRGANSSVTSACSGCQKPWPVAARSGTGSSSPNSARQAVSLAARPGSAARQRAASSRPAAVWSSASSMAISFSSAAPSTHRRSRARQRSSRSPSGTSGSSSAGAESMRVRRAAAFRSVPRRARHTSARAASAAGRCPGFTYWSATVVRAKPRTLSARTGSPSCGRCRETSSR